MAQLKSINWKDPKIIINNKKLKSDYHDQFETREASVGLVTDYR